MKFLLCFFGFFGYLRSFWIFLRFFWIFFIFFLFWILILNFFWFLKFLNYFLIFFWFFGLFSKWLRLLLKIAEVTTEHQKWPKISTNSVKSSSFAQRAKKASAEGWSPPQKLEVSPHSGLYLLVILITHHGFIIFLSLYISINTRLTESVKMRQYLFPGLLS